MFAINYLMTTVDFITHLFCLVDDKLNEADKNHQYSQAKLYPSEGVTIGVLPLKVREIEPSIDGFPTITETCFPAYLSQLDCFGYSTAINI